jgi:hypothetical protein
VSVKNLTDGAAVAGAFLTAGGSGSASGRVVVGFSGTVARTDLTAKNLFKLPPTAYPFAVHIEGRRSDASDEAYLIIGTPGNQWMQGSAFLVDGSVDPQNTGENYFSGFRPFVRCNPANQGGRYVQATYGEEGDPSTVGGPWTVTVLCFVSR